jgi:hypothetical protein
VRQQALPSTADVEKPIREVERPPRPGEQKLQLLRGDLAQQADVRPGGLMRSACPLLLKIAPFPGLPELGRERVRPPRRRKPMGGGRLQNQQPLVVHPGIERSPPLLPLARGLIPGALRPIAHGVDQRVPTGQSPRDPIQSPPAIQQLKERAETRNAGL